MAKNLIELVTGDLGDKKRYREYKARVKVLPEGYREATKALERYLMNLGPTDNGPQLITMLTDLADLMERSASDGLLVRDVVGDDPVEFVEAFMANYDGGSWIRKERNRLVASINDAVAKEREQ